MWGTAPDVTLILSISQSSESYRGCTVVSNSIVYSKCLRWVLKYEIRRWRRNGMNISPSFYQKILETFILQIFLWNWYSIFDLKRRVPISVHSLLNIKVNLESSILHDLQHFHTLNSNEISKSKTFHLCASLQITNFGFTSRWGEIWHSKMGTNPSGYFLRFWHFFGRTYRRSCGILDEKIECVLHSTPPDREHGSSCKILWW